MGRRRWGRKVLKTGVLYEVEIDRLVLLLQDGREFSFPETLSNGRASYVLFESLVRELTGLAKTTGSDHIDDQGRTYEQKAYTDHELFPHGKDLFQCSASSTFAANNRGPVINRLLEDGDYESALEICRETGYSKNDFYIFSNTRDYRPDVPFRFIVMTSESVVSMLDTTDPRMISRCAVLSTVKETIRL